jgi:hypothetical protein
MKTFYTILFLSILYIQSFAQGTPGEVGAITSIESYTTFQGYDETAAYLGQGEYQIFYDNIDGNLDKPLVICDGFDPGDTRDITSIYEIGNYGTGNMFDDLRDQGIDVILLNFPNYIRDADNAEINGGADYIERNGLIMVNLIETIKASMSGSQEFTIIGPSMGGLVTRYALTYMEQEGLDHQTGIWVSFDSPHRGANVPISFQYAVNYFAESSYINNEDMATMRDTQLNSPAAKQMLLDHYSSHIEDGEDFVQDTAIQLPTPNPFRDTFMTTMDALGFPQQTRNIALVNGSLNGTMVESPGAVLMDGEITQDSGSVDMNLHFTPAAGIADFNIDALELIAIIFGSPVTIETFDAVAESPSYTSGLDSAPGGTVLFDSYFGDEPTETEQQVMDAIQVDAFSFIPTLSSLVINDQNWYNVVIGTETTPFDNYYGPTVNEPHLTLSEEGRAFLASEIVPLYLSTNHYLVADNFTLLNNPVKEVIKVQLNHSSSYGHLSMRLYTITGQKVKEIQIPNPTDEVNLPISISSGIYLLHISNGTNSIVKKVIIQ